MEVSGTDDAANGILVVESGGTVKNGYGGKSKNGGVQNSYATVEQGGTVKESLYGGQSKNGSVEDSYAIVVQGGTVNGSTYGGQSRYGDVTSSSADVRGTVGENAYGGWGKGDVTGGSVAVRGTVGWTAYGGYSKSGGVSDSYALVEQGGIVSRDLYGGQSKGNGDVTGSSADVRGTVVRNVYGGYSEKGNVSDSYAIVVQNATVSRDLYGGRSQGNGVVTGTSVDVQGTVGVNAYGAYSEKGSVQNSYALVEERGIVSGSLYGGRGEGDVTGSSADVSGTVEGNAYGGKSENGGVQNSFAFLGSTGIVNGSLYGGYGYGDVTGSSADVRGTVEGRYFYEGAYGGYSEKGSVKDSYALVEHGGIVSVSLYGGHGKGDVTGSSVDVRGTVVGNAYGGYSTSGGVQDSFALVEQGGTVKGSLYGGAGKGDVTGSSVDVKGTVEGDAYGGFFRSGSVQDSYAFLDSTGTVKGSLYGGYSVSGDVTGSSADVRGTVEGDVYGGYSVSGDVTGNVVTAEDVTIGGSLYGGRSVNGVSSGNTVYFISGSVGGAIYGGGCVDAIENHTVISGDTGADVYGGHATTGTARGNVTDVLANVSANVYGGASDSGSAEDNVVNLYVSITGSVYGGHSGAGISSGNILNTYKLNTSASVVSDTQIVNLASEGDVNGGDVFLKSRVIVPSNGTVVNADAAGAVTLNPHESVYLIQGPISVASGGTLSIGTENLTEKAGVINDGISRSYKLKAYQRITDSEGDYVRLTMASIYNDGGDGSGDALAPQTESLVHAPLASMAMLNQGGDLIVDSFAEAEKAINWAGVNGKSGIDGRSGFIPFAAGGGNKLREEVGSHVDIDGWNFNVGAAKLTRNNLLWGVFGEYGRTSYTSHLDSGQSANGNGHYTGGGVFARKKNPGGLYYEGSFRAGRVKNDYKSDSMIMPSVGAVHTAYDYKSDYYAAHVGIGVAQQVGRRNVLDYYLRWFYTYQDDFDATLSTGENYQFDDVESSRLRLGLRYSCVLNKYSTLYFGGAWQYEFEGDSEAMYAGYNTLVPSLNGSSGMFEFGWQVKPSERSPLTLDFGAAGWFGRQKGASFRCSARWDL